MVEKLQRPDKKTLELSWAWKDSAYIDYFFFDLFEENQLHFGLFEEVQLRFTAWVMTHSLGLALKFASSQRRKFSVEDF